MDSSLGSNPQIEGFNGLQKFSIFQSAIRIAPRIAYSEKQRLLSNAFSKTDLPSPSSESDTQKSKDGSQMLSHIQISDLNKTRGSPKCAFEEGL
jgi:hypothetical protein